MKKLLLLAIILINGTASAETGGIRLAVRTMGILAVPGLQLYLNPMPHLQVELGLYSVIMTLGGELGLRVPFSDDYKKSWHVAFKSGWDYGFDRTWRHHAFYVGKTEETLTYEGGASYDYHLRWGAQTYSPSWSVLGALGVQIW